MKVILLKDVPKIGHCYEVKEVSSGHALNLLIPQGLAIVATSTTLKKYESMRKIAEAERKIRDDLLVKNVGDLGDKVLKIVGKTNEQGHLFAGIHKAEIVAEIKRQTNIDIDPGCIKLEHPLKQVGEYYIEIASHGTISNKTKTAKLKIIIEQAKS